MRDPEQRVEGRRLEKAQADTVTDMLVLLFLVSLPVHFARWRPGPSLALVALILFTAASTAVRCRSAGAEPWSTPFPPSGRASPGRGGA